MKGRYRTRRLAEAALAEHLQRLGIGDVAHDGRLRVDQFLRAWLDDKVAAGLRPTTARSYRQHITGHINPRIGHVRLRDLSPSHVQQLLAALGKTGLSGSSIRRVHATLRSALATAKRRRLIPVNPASNEAVDLPAVARPKVRPWEPGELGAFLDHAAGDRLGVLYEVLAATGLRRGEALGLRWDDLDAEASVIVVRRQIVQVDEAGRSPCPFCPETHGELAFGKPKTRSGEDRRVALGPTTLGSLIGHQFAQAGEQEAWADAYRDHGLIFARQNGDPIPPQRITEHFRRMISAVRFPDDPDRRLRRVRLHDLRHGAASLRLAAGVDIAIVSKTLGHSSISITADTYSHLLSGVDQNAAQRAEDLVPRAPRAPVTDSGSKRVAIRPGMTKGTPKRSRDAQVRTGAPPGTRTPNPRIKSPLLCQLS
jgi:integrase